MIKQILISIIFLLPVLCFAQNDKLYEIKSVDLGDIQIEYLDFGGNGKAFIWVQDMHYPFNIEPRYEKWNLEKQEFFKFFTQKYRVLAPIKRGYGNSDNTANGYDVKTQTLDLINFLKVLNIDKAIFYGRAPGQELLELAENYQQYIDAIIFEGNPLVFAQSVNPDIQELQINLSKLSCDLNDVEKIVKPRLVWRPTILDNPSREIKIPSIRFRNMAFDTICWSKRALQRGLKRFIEGDNCGHPDITEYFKELHEQPQKYDSLMSELNNADEMPQFDKVLKNSFGNYMTSFDVNWETSNKWRQKEIMKFLEKLN